MSIKLNISRRRVTSGNPGERTARWLRKASQTGMRRTARRILQDIPERINARRKPSGGRQKANSPGWAFFKIATRGHSIPLRFNDVLSDPKRYRVVLKKDSILIYPPPSRRRIIPRLRRMGYEVFEIPPEASEWMDEEVRRALNKTRMM